MVAFCRRYRSILVTNGGFTLRGGTVQYIAPCEQCIDTLKLNPILTPSNLPPGVPTGLAPRQTVPFQVPIDWTRKW